MTDPEVPSDGELVARCRTGDSGAWRALVLRYQRLVYAIVRRAGLDEHAAADVFQTVFSRLVSALPTLKFPDRLRAWIVTTAKRETLLLLHRSRRTVSISGAGEGPGEHCTIDQLADDALLPEQQLEELQQLHLLKLALDRLDRRCNALLSMLFADDHERVPYDQISMRLDMPPGSIGPTRARCLAKLRALLDEEAA